MLSHVSQFLIYWRIKIGMCSIDIDGLFGVLFNWVDHSYNCSAQSKITNHMTLSEFGNEIDVN